ncbi:hypothetical protein F4818DRAFT_16604 [Hypoxylon cercidicola]|nr:hypothetical protein F4818DRAFT_16604 [Hypoxylon cercidicola]
MQCIAPRRRQRRSQNRKCLFILVRTGVDHNLHEAASARARKSLSAHTSLELPCHPSLAPLGRLAVVVLFGERGEPSATYLMQCICMYEARIGGDCQFSGQYIEQPFSPFFVPLFFKRITKFPYPMASKKRITYRLHFYEIKKRKGSGSRSMENGEGVSDFPCFLLVIISVYRHIIASALWEEKKYKRKDGTGSPSGTPLCANTVLTVHHFCLTSEESGEKSTIRCREGTANLFGAWMKGDDCSLLGHS